MRDLLRWLYFKATEWLTKEGPPSPTPLCDFNRLGFELRKGDVLLVEGRSRLRVIKIITQSPWSQNFSTSAACTTSGSRPAIGGRVSL